MPGTGSPRRTSHAAAADSGSNTRPRRLGVNMTGYDDPAQKGARTLTVAWPPEAMQRIVRAEELEIAARRAHRTLRRWVPIWVVGAGGGIYVRTWHRRDTGWFGQVLDSRRARIRVADLEAGVAVEDIGEREADLRADSMPLTAPSTGNTARRPSIACSLTTPQP